MNGHNNPHPHKGQGNKSQSPPNQSRASGQDAASKNPSKRIPFEVDSKLNVQLFNEVAKEWANNIANPQGTKGKNEKNQIRGFYDELLRIQMQIGNDQAKFQEYLPYLLMLRSKVYYSKGRDLVNDDFVSMMDQGLEHSKKGLKEFQIFVRFFEAFLGFFKYYKK